MPGLPSAVAALERLGTIWRPGCHEKEVPRPAPLLPSVEISQKGGANP